MSIRRVLNPDGEWNRSRRLRLKTGQLFNCISRFGEAQRIALVYSHVNAPARETTLGPEHDITTGFISTSEVLFINHTNMQRRLIYKF
jgi:hypothetical protein